MMPPISVFTPFPIVFCPHHAVNQHTIHLYSIAPYISIIQSIFPEFKWHSCGKICHRTATRKRSHTGEYDCVFHILILLFLYLLRPFRVLFRSSTECSEQKPVKLSLFFLAVVVNQAATADDFLFLVGQWLNGESNGLGIFAHNVGRDIGHIAFQRLTDIGNKDVVIIGKALFIRVMKGIMPQLMQLER